MTPGALQLLFPGVYRYTSSAHAYVLICHEDAVLINLGDGDVLDHLPPGVKVHAALLTHHFADVASGAARAIRRGIPVYAPESEVELLRSAPQTLRRAGRPNNYDPRLYQYGAPEEAEVWPLRDYQTYCFGALSLQVRPTPGPTVGAVSFITLIGGQKLALTGDLLYAPGQISRLAATQWTYHGGEGLAGSVLSLLDLADARPDVVLPAHGEPMLPGALEQTAQALWPLLQLRRHNPRLLELRASPYEELRPWLLHNRTSMANSYVLRSLSGHALIIDFGYDFSFGSPVSTERDARRPWLLTVPALFSKYGVVHIDAVLPTHYHDDHVAGIPLLREQYGAQVWASENVAPVLAYPERYQVPCLWFEGITVDRRLKLGEAVPWREFTVTPYDLPGHARYAAAVLVEGHGERLLFGGDQYADVDGLGLNYTYPNLVRETDYLHSAELYERLQPDLILSGHGPPLTPGPGYGAELRARGEALLRLHTQLQPLTSRLVLSLERQGRQVTLQLDNPTGEVFEGRLRGSAGVSPREVPLTLFPAASVRLDFELEGQYPFMFEVRGPSGEPGLSAVVHQDERGLVLGGPAQIASGES
ncbi:MBL fold metallo-hydrolase [Deinococcus irradiatisoli]|uniref:MBL fold metallo-hydrolase n=1 Tax=Deinococcus irradiatisoli TaxID=2202254 RepID=UPI0015E84687|nr:MBL fold metallo-hydrolase [Deinococcus irradiatisoli]